MQCFETEKGSKWLTTVCKCGYVPVSHSLLSIYLGLLQCKPLHKNNLETVR